MAKEEYVSIWCGQLVFSDDDFSAENHKGIVILELE